MPKSILSIRATGHQTYLCQKMTSDTVDFFLRTVNTICLFSIFRSGRAPPPVAGQAAHMDGVAFASHSDSTASGWPLCVGVRHAGGSRVCTTNKQKTCSGKRLFTVSWYTCIQYPFSTMHNTHKMLFFYFTLFLILSFCQQSSIFTLQMLCLHRHFLVILQIILFGFFGCCTLFHDWQFQHFIT